MKKIGTLLAAWVAGLGAFLSCSTPTSTSESKPKIIQSVTVATGKKGFIKRGRYLVTIMGCNDCHSPKLMGPQGPEPDPARLLSGHPAEVPLPSLAGTGSREWVLFNAMSTAAVGPWGVSYAANLTSDSTGIGTWSEEQFARALKEGKSKGIATNRMLLPPMPWPNYRDLSDVDLTAIFLYLKSTKPVRNLVPQPVPPTELAKR